MSRPPLVETDAFKDAVKAEVDSRVSQAVEDALAKFATQLATARADAGTPAPAAGTEEASDDHSMMRQLAMHIANLTDQGNTKRRIDPAVLQKRNEARDRMFDLIIKARAAGAKCEYRLVREVYLNERKLAPFRMDSATKKALPVEIFWSGVPNEAMKPMNETARGIFDAFMESIGGPMTPVVGSADAKPVYMTPNGLTVKGEPPMRRVMPNFGDPVAGEYSDDLGDPHDRNARHVRVLGTVAAPALQNPSDAVPAGT